MKLGVFLALFLGATLAAAQAYVPKSDWEEAQEKRDWQEIQVGLPPLPKGELVEFYVSAASSFRFFIDPQSFSLGKDQVVRYTLVARSASGAENITYEGIRCAGLYRIYAYASGGNWSKNQRADWRQIESKTMQRWHKELHSRYFCPLGGQIHTASEGLEALRRGGHPSIRD